MRVRQEVQTVLRSPLGVNATSAGVVIARGLPPEGREGVARPVAGGPPYQGRKAA